MSDNVYVETPLDSHTIEMALKECLTDPDKLREQVHRIFVGIRLGLEKKDSYHCKAYDAFIGSEWKIRAWLDRDQLGVWL